MKYELKMISKHTQPEPGAVVHVKAYQNGKLFTDQQIEITKVDQLPDRVAFMGKIINGESAGKHKGLNIHKDYLTWLD